MRKTTVMLAMVVAMVAYSVASADVTVRTIDSFTGGHSYGTSASLNGWDFGRDADYGIAGFDGPLTSAGGGPVSQGNLADKIVMDSMQDGPGGPGRGAGGTGLVGVGPSAGFGNPSNFVGANFFVDAFSISKVGPENFNYLEFSTTSLLGGSTVNIFIDGVDFGAFAIDTTYVISGGEFRDVWIWDSAGGAEGVYGAGFYKNAGAVPEPASVALVGFMALGMLIRRRR